MFENYQKDSRQNQGILALLIKMAQSDDKVAPLETRMLSDIAVRMGLAPAEIEEVIQKPDDFVLSPPAGERERMTIFYYLLFLMRVDGKIQEEEEKLCYKAGLRLGFNEQLSADLIRVMKKYLHEDVPVGAMLDTIRKYLN